MADEKLPPLGFTCVRYDSGMDKWRYGVGASDGNGLDHAEAQEVIRRSDAEPGLRAQNAKLVEALREAGLCFDAAYIEGLQERLTEMPYETGNLRDLVERRILYADTYIKAALKGKTPQ